MEFALIDNETKQIDWKLTKRGQTPEDLQKLNGQFWQMLKLLQAFDIDQLLDLRLGLD
jgi:hypothetical protein